LITYPLTIIYMPLRWCGFIYRLVEMILGKNSIIHMTHWHYQKTDYLRSFMPHRQPEWKTKSLPNCHKKHRI
jgi:hypothetical protein